VVAVSCESATGAKQPTTLVLSSQLNWWWLPVLSPVFV
jgi:hypothetical protein